MRRRRVSRWRYAACRSRSGTRSRQETRGLSRRLRLAAVPEDRFRRIARPAVVQQRDAPVHRAGQAQPPERRGPPVPAACREFRAVIRQGLAHVMQQQIRVRVDRLPRQFRQAREVVGGPQRGGVADRALQGLEEHRAALHDGIAPSTPRGHADAQRRDVEIVPGRIGQLGIVARDLPPAVVLDVRAVLPREQARRDAHVVDRRRGDLLPQAGLAGLPAESAQGDALVDRIPHHVRPAAESERLLLRGQGKQRLFRHGLQQPGPEHGRCDAQRLHGVRAEIPEREPLDAQQRLAQSDFGAVGKCHDLLLPVQEDVRFGGHGGIRELQFRALPLQGAVLQLVAVVRVGLRSAVEIGPRQADADHQRRQLLVRRLWRIAATAARVARATPFGNERGTHTPVPGADAEHDPLTVESGTSAQESRPLSFREHRGRLRVGGRVGDRDRERAGGEDLLATVGGTQDADRQRGESERKG